MSDIKRLNYFNGQFLVETDFNDEQAYHLGMRRRLNQALQTWGVADGGLQVTTVSGNSKQVSVGAGMALDNQGREIILLTPRTLDLSANTPNSDVYVTAQYQEIQDPADHYASGGVDDYTRWTERPDVLASTAAPAADGAVISLARVHLDGSGNVAGIDQTIRSVANSKIDPATNLQLGSLSVSGNVGIGLSSAPTRKLEIGGSNGNLLWVGATSGSTANIEFAGHLQLREYGTNNLAYFQARDDSSNRDIGLRLRTQKAGASAPAITEALTIDANGNVGIRTATPAGHQLDIASSQGTAGNSAIRALFPGGGALLNAEFAALAHRGGAWTAVYAKQGAASTAAFFDGNVTTVGNLSFGSATRQMVNLWSTEYGIGVQGSTQYQRTASNFAWYRGGVHDNGTFNPGTGGARMMALNGAGDLILSNRTNPGNDPAKSACRALVDEGNKLVINYGNDFANGTDIRSDLNVTGNITSPMWKVTTVYDYVGGGLPRTGGTFSSGGGTLLIFAAGSGFRGAAAGMIGMRIRIDGFERGHAQVFTNEISSHKAFVTNSLVVGGIAAGTHTVTLEAIDALTLTDVNDRFELTVLELPFQQFVFIPLPIPPIPPIVINP